MDLLFEVAPPFLGDVPFSYETIAAPILCDLNLITIKLINPVSTLACYLSKLFLTVNVGPPTTAFLSLCINNLM